MAKKRTKIEDYEKKYILRYNLKFNKKNGDPITLAFWDAVENKSKCLHWLLDNYLRDYLQDVQGMDPWDVDELITDDNPVIAEHNRLESEFYHSHYGHQNDED